MKKIHVPIDVTPSARRLTHSLRDIGYAFPQAIADLIDNSISAGALRIDIVFETTGQQARVIVADDGEGMTERTLIEALRFGTRRSYSAGDLGRFGLGLKTASLSQCACVTVVSRRAPRYRRLVARSLDLEHIESSDRWEIMDPRQDTVVRATEWLHVSPGTVVIWDKLDRVFAGVDQKGGWGRRRLASLAQRTNEYLGMVFHRFIEGEGTDEPLVISVNGVKVEPWNPFAPGEERVELPPKRFELLRGSVLGEVWFRPFVLPPRSRFSSPEEHDRLSGPGKWNRQQGLYVYRARRLIQAGSWSGMRAVDEHTKLARAAVEFGTELDGAFRVDVAKSRVAIPPELRAQIERPVQELCHHAEVVYRRDGVMTRRPSTDSAKSAPLNKVTGIAIRTVALEVGESEALRRIIKRLKLRSPGAAAQLGW